jgi:F-type H+-transporting ATPase subunit delta
MIKEMIARRYAKALLEAGLKEDVEERITEELSALSKILEENMDLAKVLYSPAISPLKKRKVLDVISEEAGFHKLLSKMLIILTEKGRIQIIPYIYKSYHEVLDDKRGVLTAKVSYANRLSKTDTERILKQLERISGKKVNLDIREDKSLIAGVKVEMGGFVYDGSLRNKLAMLRRELTGE